MSGSGGAFGTAFGAAASQPCPCDSGTRYDACCGPLHRGEAHAVTAEQLMRSRYAAFAVGEVAYLTRTWHPRTRPRDLHLDAAQRWIGLEIRGVAGGGPHDDEGEVEFVARYRVGAREGSQHETSRFRRERGRWVYLDAAV